MWETPAQFASLPRGPSPRRSRACLPSIARDNDGIVAGRNFIYTTAGWSDSMTFGLTGDWIIRARVGPMDPIFANGFE